MNRGRTADTALRDRAEFDQGHIKGARHLSFTDFTQANLGEVIPSFETTILIYCNNNFEGNETGGGAGILQPDGDLEDAARLGAGADRADDVTDCRHHPGGHHLVGELQPDRIAHCKEILAVRIQPQLDLLACRRSGEHRDPGSDGGSHLDQQVGDATRLGQEEHSTEFDEDTREEILDRSWTFPAPVAVE